MLTIFKDVQYISKPFDGVRKCLLWIQRVLIFFLFAQWLYWRCFLYALLGDFFSTIYTNDFFLFIQCILNYVFFVNIHVKLFTDVMLFSLGPTVWGTPDVRHGWWTRDGGPADLHADGDGRRQRPVQLWHIYLYPSGSSIQSSQRPSHQQ